MKAQLFSVEFLMTLFVFIGVIYAVDDAWNSMRVAGFSNEDLFREAVLLSNNLITAPGEPAEWNSTNVKTIGLAYKRNVLEYEKIEDFTTLASNDYENAKAVLGTESDFYLGVRDSGGAVIFETENKLTDYGKVASVTRHCLLENESVTHILALGEE